MIPFLVISGLPSIRLIDVVDIFLVALLFYQVYHLVKGTNAMRIFVGILIFYVLWKLVSLLQLRLLSEILGAFISVGVILLVVVFQPEVRRFLLLVGTKGLFKYRSRRFLFWRFDGSQGEVLSIDPIVQACRKMSASLTGALIVIGKENELDAIVNTGEVIDGVISDALIENIFYKNTPLHDGAVIVVNNKIRAARCILPVSSNRNIAPTLGLRHRSAMGITEQTDAVVVVVSEQTGKISFIKEGFITPNVSPAELKNILEEEFNQKCSEEKKK